MDDIGFTSKKKENRSEEMAKTMHELSFNTYSPGVLLGNWVEERVECPPGKNYYFPKEKHYNALMSEIIRKEDFRFNKTKSITGTMSDILPHDHLKNCKENMTTTTDLAYNHYPRTRCSPVNIENEFYRFPNLSNCVENLTSWGLSEEKRAEWACALDLSKRMVTSFQYDFLTPSLQDYVKERKFTNRACQRLSNALTTSKNIIKQEIMLPVPLIKPGTPSVNKWIQSIA